MVDIATASSVPAKGESTEALPVTPEVSLPSDGPQRPEGVPDKFWDADKGEVRVADLLKSYSHLESRVGSTEEPAPESESKGATEETTDSGNEGEEKSDAEKAVDEAGLDFTALQDEYAESGELSEDTFKKLEEGGIPRDIVDQYIKGQEALAATMTSKLHEIGGGEENVERIYQWAGQNLEQSEIDTLNGAFMSGNFNEAEMAMKGLVAQYEAANGKQPSLISGEVGKTSSDTYKSTAELMRDMSDPKYSTDPAFRKLVEQKLERSNVI